MSELEFKPPEPISNQCILCGDTIPDDTMQAPKTVCPDCRRPVCVSCRDRLHAAGMEGCWYCNTIQLDETNETVQKALEEMKSKLLEERAKNSMPEISTLTGEWGSARTDEPMWGPNTPYSSASHYMAGIKDREPETPPLGPVNPSSGIWEEGYPYRDPPDVMKKKEGWGIPIDPKPDMITAGDVKAPNIQKMEEEIKDLKGTIEGIQKSIKKSTFKVDRDVQPVYSIGDREVKNVVRGPPKTSATIELEGADPKVLEKIIGYAGNKAKAGETVPIITADNTRIIPVKIDKDVVAGDLVGMDDLLATADDVDVAVPLQDVPMKPYVDVKEEAYRRTGRTHMHCQAALNHIKQAGEKGTRAQVLYIADNHWMAMECKNTLKDMVVKEDIWYWENRDRIGFHDSHNVSLKGHERDVFFIGIAGAKQYVRYRRYTLIISDLTHRAKVEHKRELDELNALIESSYDYVMREKLKGEWASVQSPLTVDLPPPIATDQLITEEESWFTILWDFIGWKWTLIFLVLFWFVFLMLMGGI